MKTIRQNLEEAVAMLRTNKVRDHLNACKMVYLDLSSVKGFDPDPLRALLQYQIYLVERYQSLSKVGLKRKATQYVCSVFTKIKLRSTLSRCQKKTFGDGNAYLQSIFSLIEKAI